MYVVFIETSDGAVGATSEHATVEVAELWVAEYVPPAGVIDVWIEKV